jgi:drug/metabolite transporter (DMT)-like permease
MPNKPSRWLVILAFTAVYLIWGSSYLGIHFAIQTLPPFLMTAVRFLLAGSILFAAARLRGASMPTRIHWRSAAIAGFILFLLNNTAIVWAEGHGVPSGIAAVLIATVPMWIVLLTWMKPGGVYPGSMVIAGLALGFVGIILLFGGDTSAVNPVGVVVVLFGAFCWAYGSLYVKNAPLPDSAPLSTGMQLLCGGVFQLAMSFITGDAGTLNLAQVSATSVVAMIYLTIVSSIIAFSAFVWLVRVSPPTKVATYAYVNPVVAVFLGALLAHEPLTRDTVIAAAIIIASVVIINGYGYKGKSLPRLRAAKVVEATS